MRRPPARLNVTVAAVLRNSEICPEIVTEVPLPLEDGAILEITGATVKLTPELETSRHCHHYVPGRCATWNRDGDTRRGPTCRCCRRPVELHGTRALSCPEIGARNRHRGSRGPRSRKIGS